MPKITMSDFDQFDYALDIYGPWWVINQRGDSEYAAVKTEGGIVWAMRSLDNWELTRLEFVYNGRRYERRWQRSWGRQTISRLAGEFARDVVEKQL